MGNLTAEVIQTGKSLELQQMRIEGGEFDIKVKKGESLYAGSSPRTSLETVVNFKDTVLSYTFKTMKSVLFSQGEVLIDSNWPGGPDQFSFDTLQAKTVGHIRNGKMIGVQSGIQRIFNFLSMSWSDSNSQIMRFYKMYFNIEIKDREIHNRMGRALFSSFYVKSTGKVDMGSKETTMEAVVTPGVEDIGSDPSEEIEEAHNLLSHTYRITGKWPDTNVSLKIF